MITRFYVDNYKCLVNFEYKPQPLELIIGANGSGKSTVFEALDKVRQFVAGKGDARVLFTPESSTMWVNNPTQVFEIDFSLGKLQFEYRLEIDLSSDVYRVEREVFKTEGQTFGESVWKKPNSIESATNQIITSYFARNPGKHIDELRHFKVGEQGAEIPLSSPNQTMLSAFPMLTHGQELNEIFLYKLNPPMMSSEIGKIEPRLNVNGSNFASYYLYVLQQKQGAMFEVISNLRNVLPGFDSFAVDEDFEQGKRRLMVIFKNLDGAKSNVKGAAPLKFSFDDLSDGQRALIVLYTLLFCALDADSTLVIDEPENYISLRELQPLIMLMEERIEEVGGQILLISHNQEFINMLTDRGKCVRFTRENNGHTRIAAFNPESELTAAEIVARGWEDDEQ